MNISDYLENISRRFALGNATEHTFRGDLQNLLESLVPEIRATNEPKRIECGAPDYVLTRNDIPVGYIEAKDIGVDLRGRNLKEQLDRYRDALDNFAVTDYLDFHFYVNGESTASVSIAEIRNGKIVSLPDNFGTFQLLINEFCSRQPQSIKSSKRLAEMMADKAKILAFIIRNAIESDEESEENSTLREQMKAFKDILIHDIDAKAFADIYAQTIAYGMFAARLHDHSLDTFTRREAAELIPKTNPFLRKLFQYIAGYDLDTRIDWIVDALADLFRATDIAAILKNFGKATQTHDPIMHFYETFLAEYDPKLRKSRGVFYTPEPVVDFIVRAVDDILKSEFNLPQGLADTSKTKISLKTTVKDERTTGGYRVEEKEVHKVQILDPATGTGTFLASVIKQIYKGFENQQGVWSDYVDNHLIPRLNGFEILMASYAMAHLKLDLLLSETGYSSDKEKRFQVYLTNALEEYHPDTGTLFANWLSTEANEANHIKRDTPVMVVIGNPPYSGESKNKGTWIMDLMEDYKREPDTNLRLQEKNSKFINDDYVKFIRYAQYFVEKNGDGVLAFINNHGYLDNPTFRGMRWTLLRVFDKIYVIDLHGNLKKKEVAPDGSADKNVFDIQPGVSINLFVKNRKKKSPGDLAEVLHAEKFGSRETKHEFLWGSSLDSVQFSRIKPVAPQYFFVDKGIDNDSEYKSFFSIVKLFGENSLGVLSKNDAVTIDFERDNLAGRIAAFRSSDEADLRSTYRLKEDSRDWSLTRAIGDLNDNYSDENFKSIEYRPFDKRWTFFTGTPRGFFAYSQNRIMRHIRHGQNYSLITGRTGEAVGLMQWNLVFITQSISDQNIFYRGGGTAMPLYLYPDSKRQTLDGRQERVPNLDLDTVVKISESVGLTFLDEKEETEGTFAPIDILDYIYAVLHSPSYRDKYKEFLKIDFPRVPYPTDREIFWQLVSLGGELREIHLLESPKVDQFITGYPVAGDNIVEKPVFKNATATASGSGETGSVYINETQYFSGVPEIAWNLYIGGYQPAQKWLKDRKGRNLSYEDVLHYQRTIVALTETIRIMKEIDLIDVASF